MKKLTIMLAACGLAATAFGQGNVDFANTSGPLAQTNQTMLINPNGSVNSGTPTGSAIGPTAPGASWEFALLMQSYSGTGPTAAAQLNNLISEGWIYTGASGAGSLGAGKISGGANTVTTAGDPGAATSTPNQFIVVGWSVADGASWSAFLNNLQAGTLIGGTYAGVSAVGTGVASSSPPEGIFNGTGLINSPINLAEVVVPEPGTLALAAIGGASLLLFRRKK